MQTSIAEFKEDAWDPAGKQPHLDPVVRSAQVGPRMAQPPTAQPPTQCPRGVSPCGPVRHPTHRPVGIWQRLTRHTSLGVSRI